MITDHEMRFERGRFHEGYTVSIITDEHLYWSHIYMPFGAVVHVYTFSAFHSAS